MSLRCAPDAPLARGRIVPESECLPCDLCPRPCGRCKHGLVLPIWLQHASPAGGEHLGTVSRDTGAPAKDARVPSAARVRCVSSAGCVCVNFAPEVLLSSADTTLSFRLPFVSVQRMLRTGTCVWQCTGAPARTARGYKVSTEPPCTRCSGTTIVLPVTVPRVGPSGAPAKTVQLTIEVPTDYPKVRLHTWPPRHRGGAAFGTPLE